MPDMIDLSGKVFGCLTITNYAGCGRNGSSWHWRCRCGVTGVMRSWALRRHAGRECWHASGVWRLPEYRSWEAMIRRCYVPAHDGFAYYGGRGIKVCDRWRDDFRVFLTDMGKRPSPRHSIERRDVNGDYTPENCYWATDREQRRNRRNTLYVWHRGELVKLIELIESLGLDRSRVCGRLKIGWSLEAALTTPRRAWTRRQVRDAEVHR